MPAIGARPTRNQVTTNRTAALLLSELRNRELDIDETLLTALRRRGFLALVDDGGIWLATGSHADDVEMLRTIDGLVVRPVTGDPARAARVSIRGGHAPLDVARHIVGLPEHHVGGQHGGFTSFGPGPFLGTCWANYRAMEWGAKLAACPTERDWGAGALDVGVGLLVKTLPLARVATSLSCDGHGRRPAWVALHYPWDLPWARAVFDTLGAPDPAVQWSWREQHIRVEPRDGFTDAAVTRMLLDVQTRSQRLLDQGVIDAIGRARRQVVDEFGEDAPTVAAFAATAARVLAGGLGR